VIENNRRDNRQGKRLFYACCEDLTQEAAWTVHIREVVDNWEKLGVRVTLFAPGIWPFSVAPVSEVVYVPTINVRFVREYLYLLILPFYILLLGLRRRPGALYCREMGLMAPIAFTARLLGIPVVMEINGFLPEEMALAAANRVKRFVYTRIQSVNFRVVSALVFVFENLKECYRTEYSIDPGRLYVVQNGVDTAAFLPGDRDTAVRRLRLNPREKHVVFIGSFYPHAMTPLIVHSAAIVTRRRSDVRFILVGDGIERPVCDAIVRDEKLSSSVNLTGYRPHDEIPSYIHASDVLINLRRFYKEGSMKMLEYLSCGGVVISNIRSIGDFQLTHGQEYFYLDDPSPEGLADAIETLLGDPSLRERIGKAARPLVAENFSWKRTAERLLSVIDEVRDRR